MCVCVRACVHLLPSVYISQRFTDKAAIAHAGTTLVPVIEDGPRVVHDSWEIVKYLETTYPQRPRLIPEQDQILVNRIRRDTDDFIMPAFRRAMILDVYHLLSPVDQHYFRASREKRFGCVCVIHA